MCKDKFKTTDELELNDYPSINVMAIIYCHNCALKSGNYTDYRPAEMVHVGNRKYACKGCDNVVSVSLYTKKEE